MSKIAAFLAPHAFIAWDEYARKGLNAVLERSLSYKFDGYADYIANMNQLLSGEVGQRVRSACCNRYPTEYAWTGFIDEFWTFPGGRSF